MAITTASRFSFLLRTFRQRAKLSQQELSDILRTQHAITLYASDISKLERRERKVPKIDYSLALIKALHLSDEEAADFLEAGNYPPTVQNLLKEQPQPYEAENEHQDTPQIQALQADFTHGRLMPADKEYKKRSMPEPPQIGEMGAQAKLKEPIPAWRLKADGTITEANLLAFWTWNGLVEGIVFPTRLIGQNVFSVFTDGTNIERIGITLAKNSFWFVKMYILILIAQLMERKLYRQILDKLMKYPVLQQLYAYAYEHPEEEPVGKDFYEYTLELKLPQGARTNGNTQYPLYDESHRLSFLVKLTVLRDGEGTITYFVASYTPSDAYTESIIAQKYRELTRCTPYEYVQSEKQTTFKDFSSSSYPYPLLHHDPYFTIIFANQALQNTLDSLAHNWKGKSVHPEGLNFFELIATDPMRKPVEALGEWEDATLRALQGLKHVKNLWLREHPQDKDKYDEKIEYLKRKLPSWFPDLYNKSLRYIIHFPETTHEPFYACKVHYLPSEQADKSTPMTIKSWVWLPDADRPYILITFIPGDLISAEMLEQLTPAVSSIQLFPPTIPTNLPSRTYEKFIGRETELADLYRYLSPHHRHGVVCLSGFGGVGKTAVALEIAHRCLKSSTFPEEERFEAIVWVTGKQRMLLPSGIVPRIPTLSNLDSLYHAIAEVLDMCEALARATTPGDRDVLIARLLAERRILLILDEFEDIDDKEILAFLTDLPSPSKAIITTRHRIDVAVQIKIEPFNKTEARDLVKTECDLHKLSLTDEQVEKLLQYTGCIPLAIVRTLGRMAWKDSTIETELQYLALADPTNTIYDFCFGRSVDSIRGTNAYKLFMALALFSAPASRDAIGAVAGLGNDVFGRDDGLSELWMKSLVNKTEDRFSLETLTKVYAGEELKANPAFWQEALKRLVGYYLKFVKKYGGKGWGEWHVKYDLLEAEWENLLAVFDLCAVRWKEDYFYAALKDFWQAEGVLHFAHLYGHWEDRITYLTKLAHRAENREEWATWVKAIANMAYSLILRGQLDEADKHLTQAWDHRENTNDAVQIKLAQYLARLRVYQNDYEDALKWLQEASNLLDKAHLDEPERTCRQLTTQNYYGLRYFKMGDYPAAERCFTEVVDRARSFDLLRPAFFAGDYLADIYIKQGRLEEAEKLIKWGLEVVLHNKADGFAATYQRSSAYLHAKRGNMDEAKRWAEEALDSFKRLGMQPEIDEMSNLLQPLGLV